MLEIPYGFQQCIRVMMTRHTRLLVLKYFGADGVVFVDNDDNNGNCDKVFGLVFFSLLYTVGFDAGARSRVSVSYEIGGFTFFVKCSRTKKNTIAILFEIVVEYQLWIMVCIQNAPHFYTKCVISLSLVALVGNSGNSKRFYNFRFHAIEESSFIWDRSEWYNDKNIPSYFADYNCQMW